jgi:hypothetical protein
MVSAIVSVECLGSLLPVLLAKSYLPGTIGAGVRRFLRGNFPRHRPLYHDLEYRPHVRVLMSVFLPIPMSFPTLAESGDKREVSLTLRISNRYEQTSLIGASCRAGERENRSGKQQGVRKVVDPLNLGRGARVEHLRDQDRPIDEQDQQHNPGTEISCRHPRLLGQQNACPGNEKNCARQIAYEQPSRNPRGHQFFERDAGACRWVQKMLNAKKYSGDSRVPHTPPLRVGVLNLPHGVALVKTRSGHLSENGNVEL